MSDKKHIVLTVVAVLATMTMSVNAQWSQVATNAPGEFTDFSFGSAEKIYVVGHSGSYNVILRSADGGTTWHGETTKAPLGKLNKVDMVDTLTGYAVGDKGLVLKRAWIPGTVGIQWHKMSEPTQENLFAVSFVTPLRGWVGGKNDRLFSTTDGGATWNDEDHDGVAWGAILDIFFLDELHGWTAGNDPNRTTDGGQTWVRMTMPVETEWRGVHFVNKDLGFLVGRLGNIARTEDGGQTWTSIWSTTGVMLMSAAFINESEGWIVGGGVNDGKWIDSSRVLHTVDGGLTWVQEPHPTDRWLVSIKAYDPDNILAVGGGGTMLRRTRPVSVQAEWGQTVDGSCEHNSRQYVDVRGRAVVARQRGPVLTWCTACGRGSKVLAVDGVLE